MTTRVRVQLWVLCAALAASTMACGSSMSTTGPTGASGSGAVISGRVNVSGTAALPVAARFPLALTVAVPLASSSSSTVTVTIAGTDISTTVDGSGNFTLTNVPPGTVQLRFQGRGADAMLTISGIAADDHLSITVTLNGHDARLDARENSSNSRGVEVNGNIDSIDLVARTLRVGGQTVVVPTSATIRHGDRTFGFADLHVGDHVQVKGTRDGSTVTASEVKVETGDGEDEGDDNNDVEGAISSLAGSCPSVTFFVGSTKVATSASTQFEDVTCGTLANGTRMEVKGTRASDGTLVATKVEQD